MANHFAFSNGSVVGARVFLFLGLALAVAIALIVPVIRLNRKMRPAPPNKSIRSSKSGS